MATISERVTLDKTSPTREFGDTIDLEVRADGAAISGTISKAVLTVADAYGRETVINSDTEGVGFGDGEVFSWDDTEKVLSMRLSGHIPTTGPYTAELDLYDGTKWYRWTTEDVLEITAE